MKGDLEVSGRHNVSDRKNEPRMNGSVKMDLDCNGHVTFGRPVSKMMLVLAVLLIMAVPVVMAEDDRSSADAVSTSVDDFNALEDEINNGTASIINLINDITITDNLDITRDITITATGGKMFTISQHYTLTVKDNSCTLTIECATHIRGTVVIDQGNAIIIEGPTTIFDGSTIDIKNDGTFTNDGTTTIDGGTITTAARVDASVGPGTIVNNDQLIIADGVTVTVGGEIVNNSSITNNGVLNILDSGEVIHDGGTITNNGTISNAGIIGTNGPTSIYNNGMITNTGELDSYTYIEISGTGTIDNAAEGYFRITGGSVKVLSGGNIINACDNDESTHDSLDILGGKIVNQGTITNSGTINNGDGTDLENSMIENFGEIINTGIINNQGSFKIMLGSKVDNWTSFNGIVTPGTINNGTSDGLKSGSIETNGVIDNHNSTINNYSISDIWIYDGGTIAGWAPIGTGCIFVTICVDWNIAGSGSHEFGALYHSSMIINYSEYVRTGYSITGFFDSSTGGNMVIDADGNYASTAVSGYTVDNSGTIVWGALCSKMLYAQWEMDYKVAYGTGVESVTINGITVSSPLPIVHGGDTISVDLADEYCLALIENVTPSGSAYIVDDHKDVIIVAMNTQDKTIEVPSVDSKDAYIPANYDDGVTSLDFEISDGLSVHIDRTDDTKTVITTQRIDVSLEPVPGETDRFTLTLLVGGSPATDFPIEVTVPCDTSRGIPTIYYDDEAGSLEAMSVLSYTETSVTFTTTHNSVYVIEYVVNPSGTNTVNVTLNANGGSVSYIGRSVSGNDYGLLPTPIRSGYSFDGWYYQGLKAVSYGTLLSSQDHTLTAYWTYIVDDDVPSSSNEGIDEISLVVIVAAIVVALATLALSVFRRS